MKKVNIYLAGLLSVIFVAVSSCTGENITDDNRIKTPEILDQWIKVNRPDMAKYKDGFYLTVNGAAPSKTNNEFTDSTLVAINYQVLSLDGNYSANTYIHTARELGTYSNKAHYVPFPFIYGKFNQYNGINVGIYEALKTMKKGDVAEMYVTPAYGYGSQGLDSVYLGFTGNKGLAAGQLVHVKMSLDSAVLQPKGYEKYVIADYVRRYFSGENSQIVHEGIYMKKTLVNPNIKDTIPSDTTLKIDYVGFLPNGFAMETSTQVLDATVDISDIGILPKGFVFDTSLEEVAQQRHIYESGTTYEPYSYSFNKKDTSKWGNTIKAWKYVIENMRLGEKAYFIANSQYCYGNSGKYTQGGPILPAFTPLIFYIHVLTPEEADAREEE